MKKKILMLFYRSPFSLNGGDRIRMNQMINMLSPYFEIDVLYIEQKGIGNTNIDNDTTSLINRIIFFEFNKIEFYLNTLKGFITNTKPLQVNYFSFKKVKRWVDENSYNYDFLFCSTIRMSEYIENKDNIKIIDFVDALSMNYKKAYSISKLGLWKLIYYVEKSRVSKYEQKVLELFDRRIIISEIDKNYIIKDNDDSLIKVLKFYVETNTTIEYSKEEEVITFVGKMDYEPNVNAVINFAEHVFPKVLETNSNVWFYIVGVNPVAKVKNLALQNNIKVTGYVDDISSYYEKSKLIVAPMISGAGLQHKIIQALTNGKCVITTSIGADGLGEINRDEIIISDDNNNMAKIIIDLLDDHKRRNTIGEKGSKYVKRNFSKLALQSELYNYILNERN